MGAKENDREKAKERGVGYVTHNQATVSLSTALPVITSPALFNQPVFSDR